MFGKIISKLGGGRSAAAPAGKPAETKITEPLPASPATPPPPAECQFDSEDLVERLMGNENLARRVAAAFVNTMPQQLAALAKGIHSFDAEATRLAAHSIKGAAANAGATVVRNIASKLEELGESGSLDAASRVLPELTQTFESVKPVMERFCQSKA